MARRRPISLRLDTLETRVVPATFTEVEPNNTQATGNVITIPNGDVTTTAANDWLLVSGVVSTNSESDFYTFTLGSASGVFFDIDSIETGLSTTFDSLVTIYNSGGTLLSENDDGYDFEGFNTPTTSGNSVSADSSLYIDLAAGTYAVRVKSFSSASNGAYTLRILADTTYSSSPPVFNSFAGAADTLYLDFDGHTTSGAAWGAATVAAYDLNGNAAQFNPAERLAIYNLWRGTSEDYSPFAINVTTATAPASMTAGASFRSVITNSDATVVGQPSGIYGVNYVNIYGSGTGDYRTGFTFAGNFGTFGASAGFSGAVMAATVEQGNTTSHEFGHGLGLSHYPSQTGGTGTVSPNAIMGTPDLGLNRERWSTGTTTSNAAQDDMAVISNSTNTFGYRADDHAATTATATVLTASGNSYSATGRIGLVNDTDWFRFAGSGSTTITVDVSDYFGNLDSILELRDSAGTVLATSNPSGSFDSTITQSLAFGTYYITVSGPNTTGFVGQYTVQISTTVLAPPVLAAIETTALAYNENQSLTVTGTLTVNDPDSTNIAGATVAITSNYVAGQDFLDFTTQNGISGSYSGGILTLTGTTTKANYQTALRSVQYRNNSENPSTSTRTVSFSVSDPDTNNSNSVTRDITVTAANDAPELNNAGDMSLVSIAEDNVGNNGTLITGIIDSAGGDRITDSDVGAVEGIAITAADTSNGTWEYTINGGTNWTSIGAVSNTDARLLAANANTRLRFVPNANFNGTVSTGVTFRAWDQTSGTNGSTASTATNGGTSSFSTATETASITVTPENDAPVLNNAGNMALDNIAEDNVASAGTTITALIASAGGDRITDVDALPLEGIAITAADTANGTWEYTTDGTTWNALGSVSSTNARLLADDGTTRVRFLPNANFNGTVTSGLTFRAWDRTSGTNGTLVDPNPNGGITAFSTATETASITVTPVNDAPVLDPAGNMTLSTILEDELANAGTLITTLLGSDGDRISDVDTLPLEGIAITAADTANGSWQYTTDGTTWNALGSVSNSNARLLAADSNTRVRFVPNANFNGTVSSAITFRAWDQATGTNGSLVDPNPVGGSSAFSTATDTASIAVTAVNDIPSFTNGVDDTVLEDSGLRTISSWATSISAGPSDESGQTLTFIVTTNNDSLFSTLPAVSNTGTLTFTPAANANGTATVTIRVQDNGGTANGGVDTSANQTFLINVTPVNDAPVLDNTGNMALDSVAEDDAANPGTLITTLLASDGDRISDIDTLPLEGIAITAANTTNGTWEYTINGTTWNALGAVSATNARLLAADVNTRVRFLPATNFVGTVVNAITFHAWDRSSGTNGTLVDPNPNGGITAFSTATETANITVTPVNDAPELDNTGSMTLDNAAEDDVANAGTLITTLLASAGDRISDIDTLPLEGIAITATNTTNGTWEYTINGTTWNAVGVVSNTSALLLAADNNTRVRFLPATDFNGSVTSAITFRAWDQTSGANGTKVSTATNGGITAFSTATETADLIVAPVNDAPVLNNAGNMALDNIAEDNVTSAGTTIAVLIASAGGDRITDVDTLPLEGIAITAADTANGTWQFTTNGSTWNALGSVSGTNARLLADDANTRIRFLPNANFNGVVSSAITFRAWDRTSGSNGTLADPNPNGGITAFSIATETADLTVTPENDAPVLNNAGNMALDNIAEDATTNVGTAITALIASAGGDRITDVDASPLEGIAITAADTANGTWEYTINNGTAWNALGSVSGTNARLLAADANTRVRFVPNANYNGTVSTALTFRAWDQTSGSNGALTDPNPNGGTSAFSTNTETASIIVMPVNDAPVLDIAGDMALDSVAENDINNPGTFITDLLASAGDRISDVDALPLEGIAITAADTANGTWQFTTNGSTWNALGTVGATSARLLAADANTRIRFLPATDFNGAIPTAITFRAWDRTSGTNGTLVDPNPNGGITAFSTTTETASLVVLGVNNAPVLDPNGNMFLSAITEDNTASAGTLISVLLNSDGDRINDVDLGANEGIAITAADTTNGTWQYSINNGTDWNALGAVSATNARLLASDANSRVRFVPNANFNGTVASAITFRAWDRTAGANGTLVDPNPNGGTSPFSTATDTASITVTPENDAPVLNNAGNMALDNIAEDNVASAGTTITALIASAGGDRITDVDASPLEGIAITAADTANGTWEYTTDGTTWNALGSVSGTNARLLADDGTTRVRFLPNANFNGTVTNGLTFRAWDRTSGTNGTLADPNPNGGITAFSTDTETASITVTPVNDAPVLDTAGNMTLSTILEDELANAGTLITTLLGSDGDRISDVDTLPLEGIAITAADTTNGSWQYTTDGTTWNALGAVTNSNARLLAAVANTRVRFVPNANFNGTVSSAITFRAWDQATGTNGSLVDPNPVGGTSAFSTAIDTASIAVTAVNDIPSFTKGVDDTVLEDSGTRTISSWASSISAGPSDESGQTLTFIVTTNNDALFSTLPAVSNTGTLTFTPAANANGTATVTIRVQDNGGTANGGVDTSANQTFLINVTPVNDAPVLDIAGNMTLTPILEDEVANAGTSITTLLASAGDRISDIDTLPLEGIAITAADTANGSWQYTTDGSTWNALGAVTNSNARLLAANANTRVRFVPNANFNGTVANAITFRAWDQATGSNGSLVSTATNGGTTAFSTTTETASISVTAVNDLPTFTMGPNDTIPEDNGPRSISNWATSIGAGPSDESGQTLTFVISNDNPSLFSTQPSVSLTGTLTYTPVANASGSAIVTIQLQDNGTAPNITPPQTFSITVTAVNDAPVLDSSSPFTLNAIAEDDVTNAGTAIVDLIASAGGNRITDIDVGAVEGIAITAADTTNGTWEYTVNNGTNWLPLGAVSVSTARLLAADSNTRLRFVPASQFSGSLPTAITFVAWDQATGTNGGTGNATTTGGTTAFSTNQATASLLVNDVNDLPTYTPGANVTVPEDAGAQSLAWASNITTGAPNESSQTLNFLTSTNNDALFAVLPALSAAGVLTFTPAADASGVATITVQLQDNGTAPNTTPPLTFTITVSNLNDAPILSSTGTIELPPMARTASTSDVVLVSSLLGQVTVQDSDVNALQGIAIVAATGNGTWEYSLDNGSTWLALTGASLSNARLLAPSTTLRFVPLNSSTGLANLTFHAWDQSAGSMGGTADLTVGTGGSTPFSIASAMVELRVATTLTPVLEDTKKPKGDLVGTVVTPFITDVDAGAKRGVAIIATSNNNQGTWQYSLNKGKTWKTLAGVSSTQALLLRDTDRLRFLPNSNSTGSASFRFHAWDQSTGTAGAFANLTTGTGGATPFSATNELAFVFITPVNDAPLLDTAETPKLPNSPPNTVDALGTTVQSILGPTATDIDGNTVGMAIIGAKGKGMWQYQRQGETTWTGIGVPTTKSALLLNPQDRLRFLPNADFVGTATVTYRAWDGTFGTAHTNVLPGKSTAFSKKSETVTLRITNDVAAVPNTAPVLDNSANPALPDVLEDSKPTGTQVVTLVGSSITDADAGALQGIAVVGGTGLGTWQYSTNGKKWVALTGLSPTQAVLLRATDYVRFLPTANQSGAATLTFHAWDRTRGVTAGMRANLANGVGGSTPFSTAQETVAVQVLPVNDAPVLNTKPVVKLTSILPADTNSNGDLVSHLTTNASDIDGPVQGIALTATSGPGTWQFQSNAVGPWNAVGTVSKASPLFLNTTDRVRFVPTGSGTAKLSYQAWDGSAVSTATETATLLVNATFEAPTLPKKTTTLLTPIVMNDTNANGDAISALVLNASDSDPNAVLGIAITAATTPNGTWQIMTDGVNWVNLGTVSKASPQRLLPTDRLRFVPNTGFVGVVSLTYVAWDSTSPNPLSATALSKTTATAKLAVNHAPQLNL